MGRNEDELCAGVCRIFVGAQSLKHTNRIIRALFLRGVGGGGGGYKSAVVWGIFFSLCLSPSPFPACLVAARI